MKGIYFLGKGQVVNLRVTPTASRSCSPSSMLSSSKSCPTPAFVFPPTTGQSSSTSAHWSPSPSTPHLLEPLSDEEMKGLFSALALTSTKSIILSMICLNYVPKSLDEDLPMCLLDLMKPENLKKRLYRAPDIG